MDNIELMPSEISRKFLTGKIPGDIIFLTEISSDGRITAVCRFSGNTKELRKVDPWLMVCISAIRNDFPDRPLSGFRVELSLRPGKCDLESLIRRLSYLALNNGWRGVLLINGETVDIYQSCVNLLTRPAEEKVYEQGLPNRKDSADSTGSIEKHFQTWLAGGEHKANNERFAILGPDFVGCKYPVHREFRVGVFDKFIREYARVISKGWIDFVTFNNRNELALIELKVDGSSLAVMAQALDYALYFACYRTKLYEVLTGEWGKETLFLNSDTPIICYIANNVFHPHFKKIAKYYAPKLREWKFSFSQIELGTITKLGA